MTNSFDRLLRDALEPPPPDGGGSCFDAETVAAWCDGSLDATARAAAEAHAAGCARCQALMAAMMRTEPAVPPRPWWRSPAFGWLAPLTVATAAVLIWVRVPQRDVPMASVAPAVSPRPSLPDSDADGVAGPQESRRQSAAETPAPPVTPPSRARTAQSVDARARSEAIAIPPPLVPIEALPERVGTPVVVPAPVQAEAQAAPATPPAAMADAARMQTSSRPVAAAAPPPQSQPSTPPLPRSEKAAGGLAETLALNASARRDAASQQPEIVVPSPDRFTRWRIAAPGVVQRTTDNGATWDVQRTGYPAILTAGSAPSNTVCWLVGKGGVVLLSTDGRTWRRASFPETVDLVAITATDETTATITAVSGRTWTTTNGGAGWK